MPVFRNQNGQLHKLSIGSISKEKDLQTLVENNLGEALEMHFLASEYTTTLGGRIDTLAVDYTGAPVIIEYKRNANDNVINQGLSYLRWLQAQKVEFFEMLLIKKLGPDVSKKLVVDWKNPRVVCIAESYNKFDIDTVEVVPIRIELFKYRYYEGDLLSLEPLTVNKQKSKQSGKVPTIKQNVAGSTNGKLLDKASQSIKPLLADLRSKILEIDANISEKFTNEYLAYRLTKNFVEIHVGKNQLKIYLRPIDFDDPQNRIEKVPDTYNWTMNRRIFIKSKEDLDYVFPLIIQSYNDVL